MFVLLTTVVISVAVEMDHGSMPGGPAAQYNDMDSECRCYTMVIILTMYIILCWMMILNWIWLCSKAFSFYMLFNFSDDYYCNFLQSYSKLRSG